MKLPDKSSELLDLALNELKKREKSEDYKIDMNNHWHRPFGLHIEERSMCRVCLAGCVMDDRGLNFDKFITPEKIKGTKKYRAIEAFRCGCVKEGLEYMGEDHESSELPPYINISQYGRYRNEFFRDMEWLISELKDKGL